MDLYEARKKVVDKFINDFILSGIGSVDGKSSDYSLNDIDYITSAKFIIKSISAEIF